MLLFGTVKTKCFDIVGMLYVIFFKSKIVEIVTFMQTVLILIECYCPMGRNSGRKFD